jgi:hypothetical protein
MQPVAHLCPKYHLKTKKQLVCNNKTSKTMISHFRNVSHWGKSHRGYLASVEHDTHEEAIRTYKETRGFLGFFFLQVIPIVQ